MNSSIVPQNLLSAISDRNKGRRYQIVALPDYIVKTFAALGVTLSDLDDMFRLYVNQDNVDPSGRRTAWMLENKLLEWFESKLSRNDISDIMVANGLISELLTIKNRYADNVSSFTTDTLWCIKRRGYEYDDSYRDFINFYSDSTLNLAEIVLVDENNAGKIVDTVVTETTLFVILHRGFTNFKVYTDLSFKKKFASFMLNLVFRSYGEEATVCSGFFRDYVTMIMLNTKNPH